MVPFISTDFIKGKVNFIANVFFGPVHGLISLTVFFPSIKLILLSLLLLLFVVVVVVF